MFQNSSEMQQISQNRRRQQKAIPKMASKALLAVNNLMICFNEMMFDQV